MTTLHGKSRHPISRIWPLRFTLRALLLLPVVCAVTFWWWVTWPERTTNKFVDLINNGRLDEANSILSNAEWVGDFPKPARARRVGLAKEAPKLKLEIDDRTASDKLLGRLQFRLSGGYNAQARFATERGRISLMRADEFDGKIAPF